MDVNSLYGVCLGYIASILLCFFWWTHSLAYAKDSKMFFHMVLAVEFNSCSDREI